MKRPSVFVAMACYDTVKVETTFSLLNLFNKFTMHQIPAEFRTAKSPYVGHCRNLLTAGFLHSDKDYLLFVDADMQFGADSVFRMLAGDFDVCCTPYRLKDAKMKESYPVSFEQYDDIKILPNGLLITLANFFDILDFFTVSNFSSLSSRFLSKLSFLCWSNKFFCSSNL